MARTCQVWGLSIAGKEGERDFCAVSSILIAMDHYGVLFGPLYFFELAYSTPTTPDWHALNNNNRLSIESRIYSALFFSDFSFRLFRLILTISKFRLMVASTLNDDGEPDSGVYDPLWEEKATRTQPFDYIMHGRVYRVEGDDAEVLTRL